MIRNECVEGKRLVGIVRVPIRKIVKCAGGRFGWMERRMERLRREWS
jgi:hypothetical protein